MSGVTSLHFDVDEDPLDLAPCTVPFLLRFSLARCPFVLLLVHSLAARSSSSSPLSC